MLAGECPVRGCSWVEHRGIDCLSMLLGFWDNRPLFGGVCSGAAPAGCRVRVDLVVVGVWVLCGL